jgi:UDP-N-acetylmuramoylalanine--D-glutamate ligase
MSQDLQLILGAGVSGLSMARWCRRQGQAVCVVDTREAACARAREAIADLDVRHLPLDAAVLEQVRAAAIWVSPGLSPDDWGGLREAANRQGLPVGNEVDLFAAGLAQHAGERAAPICLAVTGTNGKTTVTALTTHLLQAAGVDAVAAGNIGPAMLDALSACLDADRWPAAWVLELSSFQLQGCQAFSPDAATVLNLSPDHLDWHGDMAAYAAAKARIFGPATHRILNRADPQVMQWQPDEPPPKRRRKVDTALPPTWTSFAADLPTRLGDWGIETVNGMAWLVQAQGLDSGSTNARDDEPLFIQRLMPAEALRIRGRHNWTNALAALALASRVGPNLASMLHALRDYAGEAHRVQSVQWIGDVEYIDDSKGTNVGATLAALHGLGADRRLVVILGGDGKGQDFAPLREALQASARAVVLIGRDAGAIADVLRDVDFPIQRAASLPEAVRIAQAQARGGDVVLLSPACASFDMFDHYGHRAQVFVDAVQALAEDAGVAP